MNLRCVLFLLAGLLSCAHADESAPVSGTKTVGTVTMLEARDVACYIYLKDEQGVEFAEMADFALCERSEELIGNKVKLDFEPAKVLADECQGNPDCGKVQEVMKVVGVQVIKK